MKMLKFMFICIGIHMSRNFVKFDKSEYLFGNYVGEILGANHHVGGNMKTTPNNTLRTL
jgi:hypothetical protein